VGGVSAFGLGGTNAHLVLESAPPAEQVPVRRASKCFLLPLSARSENALRQIAGRYGEFLSTQPAESLGAVCGATALRRSTHEHRATFVADDRDSMVAQLSAFASEGTAENTYTGRYRQAPRRKVLFVYPHFETIDGPLVTRLADEYAPVMKALQKCAGILSHLIADPLPPMVDTCSRGIVTQSDPVFPLLQFAVQLAITRLWQSAGVQPDAVAGQGIGQAAACYISGSLDLTEALSRLAIQSGYSLRNTSSAKTVVSQHLPCYTPLGRNIPPEELRWDLHDASTCEVQPFLSSVRNEVQADPLLIEAEGFEHALASMSSRHNVNWQILFSNPEPFIPLPRYPWQHTRYWLEGEVQKPEPVKLQPPVVTKQQDGLTLDRQKLSRLSDTVRRPELIRYLKAQVAGALQMPAQELDAATALNSIGMDSLTAVEVKNRVERNLAVVLPIVRFLDGYSIENFADYILSEVFAASVSPVPEIDPALWAQVEAIPAEQLDAMLQQLMSAAPSM
jgi:acyl transferase domain-containing protein